jgi:endoglucanase
MLRVRGPEIVDAEGKAVRLRGVCVGGWMNMENFINGYPGDESGTRRAMAEILGPARAEFLFDRWLDYFFTEDDAVFLKECGANVVRLALNYRHFENDFDPFRYMEGIRASGARRQRVRTGRAVCDPGFARRAGVAEHRLALR